MITIKKPEWKPQRVSSRELPEGHLHRCMESRNPNLIPGDYVVRNGIHFIIFSRDNGYPQSVGEEAIHKDSCSFERCPKGTSITYTYDME